MNRIQLPPAWWLVVVLGACSGGLSDNNRRAVRTWLLCDECTPTDLTTATNLGDDAVDLLDTALHRALPQDREQLRRTLIETYARIGPLPATESEYVARNLGDFDALFQIRAAIALGEIDTPRSRDALRRAVDSAEVRGYRPDVLAKIEHALVTAGHPAFAGSFEPDTVEFLDTVVVSQGAGVIWSGDEKLHVTGAPFPNDTLAPRTTDSLKFLAVANVGDHAVLITSLGTGADTQVARLVVRQLSYSPHTPAAAPNLTAGPFPPVNPVYLALGSRMGDTTDHFRLEPAAPLGVTAILEWAGVGPLSLSWRLCPSPQLPVLPIGDVLGHIVDEQGTPQGGAIVEVVGMPFVGATTTPSGDFALSLPPVANPIVELRVGKVGYRPLTYFAQRGVDRHVATLIRNAATDATARSIRTSSVAIPPGACRLLRVHRRSTSGTQIARLRFTSP